MSDPLHDDEAVRPARWQKVVGAIGIALILALGALLVGGEEGHGPGRHGPSDGDGPPAAQGEGH